MTAMGEELKCAMSNAARRCEDCHNGHYDNTDAPCPASVVVRTTEMCAQHRGTPFGLAQLKTTWSNRFQHLCNVRDRHRFTRDIPHAPQSTTLPAAKIHIAAREPTTYTACCECTVLWKLNKMARLDCMCVVQLNAFCASCSSSASSSLFHVLSQS